MRTKATSLTNRLPGWNLPLLFPWLAGALGPQVPFQLRYKLGNGNFGNNILLSLGLFALGIMVVVGLARFFRTRVGDARREALLRRSSTGFLGAATLLFGAAFIPGIPYFVFWLGAGALVLWLAVSIRLTAGAR
ncbi:MAG: hypothetical protein GWO24_04175, partial [Akkermansiaceae bacterium]|nr:hypothetical protein [Akkermansiaceae bacterium]